MQIKFKSQHRVILKDVAQENKVFNFRVILGWLGIILALSFVVMRLFFLQVTNHEQYTTLSENNRLKILPLTPSRGFIYDRNGVLLAENRASYRLEITPEKVEDMDATLKALSEFIRLTDEDISRFKNQLKRARRFHPVPLRYYLNEDEVARFAVQRHRFDGVDVSSDLSRRYPLGSVGAHIVGYVGRINEQELTTIDRSNYTDSEYIGKLGIEKAYETALHGKVGFQHVETNVQGRILRVLERTAPVPGRNLYLNVDFALQAYTEDLIKNERAAVVAIEPATGSVITLASMPSFDPNLFVGGIDSATYKILRDSPDRPLYNRALRGVYPPGSTVKPFVALAGLEYGIRTEGSQTWCPGWYTLSGQAHRYRDWKRTGHGYVNLVRSIEQSCDVYYYDLAHDLGIDRLYTFMTRFGFGKKTDIDLTGELSGLMPSKEWKTRVRKTLWYPGETLITGIGQGYMLSTPLQLAVATAALSMRGQLRQPRVGFALDDPATHESEVIRSPLQAMIALKDEKFWDASIRGMEAVVSAHGTARKVGFRSPYRFAGKTGTAQVFGIKQDARYDARKIDKKLHDHAWFIAFAPLDDPKIAVAVIVENGGSGSGVAAPIAKKVMDYYLLGAPATSSDDKDAPATRTHSE